MDAISLTTLIFIGKVLGLAGSFVAGLFGVFKVLAWIKNKFINIESNIVDMRSDLKQGLDGIKEGIIHQTQSLTSELKEQRQDFRTFYATPMLLMQQTANNRVPYAVDLVNPTAPALAPARAKRARKQTKKKTNT